MNSAIIQLLRWARSLLLGAIVSIVTLVFVAAVGSNGLVPGPLIQPLAGRRHFRFCLRGDAHGARVPLGSRIAGVLAFAVGSVGGDVLAISSK